MKRFHHFQFHQFHHYTDLVGFLPHTCKKVVVLSIDIFQILIFLQILLFCFCLRKFANNLVIYSQKKVSLQNLKSIFFSNFRHFCHTQNSLKRCVPAKFLPVFCSFKGEPFLFHFENFFYSLGNKALTFHILLKVNSLVMKFNQFMLYHKRKIFIKKLI